MRDLALTVDNLHLPDTVVEQVLGSGAFGTVYKVRRAGQSYALKVLHAALRNQANVVARFFREGATMVKLADPGVIKVHEFGYTDDETPYILMELVEGKTLALRLQDGPLPPLEALRIGQALAWALAGVHAQGIVHRDVRPSNVMLGDNGRVCLIDLGLSVATRAQGEDVAGSFLYSAPEQTGVIRRAIDARADLYALGVTLFEALAGGLPFAARDLGELAMLHATAKPPIEAVDNALAGLPSLAGFARIVERLMAKDPDDRYASATSLAQALGQLAGSAPDDESSRHLSRAPHDAFIGRDDALRRLEDAWKRARSGRGGVALITGEPGAGKSTLAEVLITKTQNAARTPLILRSKCTQGGKVPFAALRDGLDAHIEALMRLPPAERADQSERLRRAAGAAAPLLAMFTPRLRAILAANLPAFDPAAAAEQYLAAVSTFFARLASEWGSAVIYLDDVQWLDDASQSTLERLSTRGLADQPAPLLVLCTGRSDPSSKERSDGLAKLVGRSLLALIELTPIGPESGPGLVSAHLGAGEVDAEFATQLCQRMQGNPFAVGEYLRAMIEAGRLRYAWGRWQVDERGLARLRLPSDVISLVLRRMETLAPASRRILAKAAFFGNYVRIDQTADICGVSEDAVEAAFADAVSARLLEAHDAGYLFMHDRIRDALLSDTNALDAAACHVAVAKALKAAAAAGDEGALFRRAHHLCQAGTLVPPLDRVAACEQAALLALGKMAFAQTQALFSEAAGIAAEASLTLKSAFWAAGGEAAFQLGLLDDGILRLKEAIAYTDESRLRAERRLLLSRIFAAAYRNAESSQEADRALRDVGYTLPPNPGRQVLGAFATLVTGVLVANLPRLRRPLAPGEAATLELRLRIFTQLQYMAQVNDDKNLQLGLALRAPLAAYRLDSPFETAFVHARFGAVFTAIGAKRIAVWFLTRAERIVEREANPLARVMTAVTIAAIYSLLGDTAAAKGRGRQVFATQRQWLDATMIEMLVNTLSYRSMARGNMTELAEWAVRSLTEEVPEGESSTQALAVSCHLARRAAILAAAAKTEPARAAWTKALQLFTRADDSFTNAGATGIFLGSALLYFLEAEPTSDGVETVLRLADERLSADLRRRPFFTRFLLQIEPYVRFRAWLAEPEEPRRQALARSVERMRRSPAAAQGDVHARVFAAMLAWTRQDAAGVDAALDGIDQRAVDEEMPLAAIETARLRALAAARRGRTEAALTQAKIAALIATESGSVAEARALRRGFGLPEDAVPNLSAIGSTQSFVANGGESAVVRGVKAERYLAALLEVSQAATSVLDPAELARSALSAILRILGAERAFLFLARPEGGVQASWGRDHDGKDVAAPSGFSMTVVAQAMRERSAVVVTGTDKGVSLVTESIVANDLRSIIAAPLVFKDAVIGAVYLDSRIARGVFTKDDASILAAVSGQIAISLETSRMTRIEFEKQEMEKDLEVAGAVQSLLLPDAGAYDSPDLRLRSLYLSASRSGGDWWWYEAADAGSLVLLVGDVTGHGVGAAMITASVAGCYQGLLALRERLAGFLGPDTAIGLMHECLKRISDGEHLMTMTAMRFDLRTSTLEVFGAGAPPVLILRADGTSKATFHGGSPLGFGELDIGRGTHELRPGDRIAVFSDGVYEMTNPDGKQLGLRRLARLVEGTRGMSLDEAMAHLQAALDNHRCKQALADDLTLVLIDV